MTIYLKKPFIKVIGLAGVAGMRAMIPLAMLTKHLAKNNIPRLRKSNFNFMQSKAFSNVLSLAAIGELVGDKSTYAPNRADVGGVLGRAISGALTGATVYKSAFKNPYKGAMIGLISAVAFTYTFFKLRKALSNRKGINKNAVAVAEDTLAIAGGMLFI